MKPEKILKNHEKRITALEEYIITDGKTSKGKEVDCEHCRYEWRSTSKLETVTCPSCNKKTLTNKSNLPDNYELIKMRFGKGAKVKCNSCLDLIKDPKKVEYRHPNVYCKKCFKELNKADRKEIDRGLKKIL